MKDKNDPVLPLLENVDKPEDMQKLMDKYCPTKKSLMPQQQIDKQKEKQKNKKKNKKKKHTDNHNV